MQIKNINIRHICGVPNRYSKQLRITSPTEIHDKIKEKKKKKTTRKSPPHICIYLKDHSDLEVVEVVVCLSSQRGQFLKGAIYCPYDFLFHVTVNTYKTGLLQEGLYSAVICNSLKRKPLRFS